MDHLPTPSQPSRQINVPYLVTGKYIYDGLDFHQFPERNNWTVSRLIDVLGSDDDALDFLQSWLYFGTLSEVFGINGITINKDDYTEDERVLTSKLPIHVAEYLTIEKSLPAEIRMQHQRRVGELLPTVCALAVRFENNCSSTTAGSVLFSITILSTSLASLLYNSDFIMGSRRFLNSLMLEEGWCPNQVAMTSDIFTDASRYYIYILGPHRSGKDHSRCTKEDCALNQIDETSYKTKHSRDDCECGWVKPDIEEIIAIAERGGIPLVSLSLSGPLDCRIEEFKPGMRYAAISHVWADGLGNPHENCLPQCQMELLKERLSNLPSAESEGGRVYFWMDTLCVPLFPPSAKKAAILTMRNTYAEAEWVLVLDADTMAVACPPSALEARIRIVTSAWYSRLWTYQECVLAKSLHFQFRDGLLTGHELYLDEKQVANGASVDNLVRSWPRSVTLGNHMVTGNTEEGKRSLLNGLRWKSTTKIRDEPICMSALLNLDMVTLMSVPEDQRFKCMLSLQKVFWSGMLFYSGPRMEEYRYRWAPQSFMSKGDPIPFGMTPAWFTWHNWGFAGLTFQSIGFSFTPANNVPTTIKEFKFTIPHTGDIRASCISYGSSNFWPELVKEESPVSLAIMPSNAIPMHNGGPPVVAAVVIILKRENLIFARFICLVQMRKIDDTDTTLDLLDMGTADVLPFQWWCVG